MKVVGLFTGCLQIGGIEQVNRHTAATLSRFARASGQPCHLLSLNDERGLHVLDVDGQECVVRGFGRKKAHFVAHAVCAGSKSDLAYVGHPHLAPLGLLLRIVNRRLRFWVVAHGIEVWQRLPPLRRRALQSAHRVIAVSEFTAKEMILAQHLDERRVTVLSNALDPSFTRDATAEALDFPPRSCRAILSVGRLLACEPGKGVDLVIRALPRVLKSIPSACYIVVGGGDQIPDLQRLAQSAGVCDRICFVGEIGPDELRAHYRAAEIFVMPSRQEGFGIVFLEAMSFGKPVIAANHGGAREVVVDGVTGFLVEYGDLDALADRIIRLLSTEELGRRMGEAGRHRATELYSFQRFQRRLMDLLLGDDGSSHQPLHTAA